MEEWRDISGYEGLYQVSDLGRVKSLDRLRPNGPKSQYMMKGRTLSPGVSGDTGYLTVNICGKSYSIHRLVAKTFISNLNNLPEVNHKDQDKTNNNLNNLEWVTRSENTTHGVRKRKFHSKYAGVTWDKARNRWRVILMLGKQQKFIGRFKNEIEAGQAYINALDLYGIQNKYAKVA